MQTISTKLKVSLFLISIIVLGAFSGQHPTTGGGGYTNAPGDNACFSCHGGTNPNITGSVEITGLPATIMPNTTYTITVTTNRNNATPTRAGFQMVALNQSNQNAGSFSNNSSGSSILNAGGKQYFGHNPATNFGSNNSVSWQVTWTSPNGSAGQQVTFYGISVLANGNGSSSGDRVVTTTNAVTFGGSATPPTVQITNIQNTNCHDSADGSMTAVGSGGTGNLSYAWSNGANTAQINGLSAGSYTVTVTDAAGATGTANATITSPTPVSITLVNISNNLCANSTNGYATVQAQGGTPNYTYQWSNGATGASVSNLAAGNYSVTATDARGCQTSTNVSITAPSPIVITTQNISNVSCSGLSNGAASVSASGGTGNISFQWSNGMSGPNISGLSAGTYTVTATDQNACNISSSVQITQPGQIFIQSSSFVNPNCAGESSGSLQVSAGGGTAPYSYNWNNGQTTATIQNLPSGMYTVTVTDANQCSRSFNYTLQEPSVIIPTIEVIQSPGCDTPNGGILRADRGNAEGNNLSYLWSNGAETQEIGSLSAGVYTVTITDGSGCTGVASQEIMQSTDISINFFNTIQPSCLGINNGVISAVASGGSGGFTNFLWSNGATTALLSGVGPGLYTITVTDATGCTATNSFQLNPAIDYTAEVGINAVSCFNSADGSIEVEIIPAGGNFEINWVDLNEPSPNRTALQAGTYSFSAINAQGCIVELVDITIVQPEQLEAEVSIPFICTGETEAQVSVEISGGIAPYNLLWSNGSENVLTAILPLGSNSVQINDANGCTLELNFNVEVQDSEDPLTANTLELINASSATASDGSISVEAIGGSAPYQYRWTDAAGNMIGTESSITDLMTGIYNLEITDQNGCTFQQTYMVDFVNSTTNPVMNQVNIYPNPSPNMVFIKSSTSEEISGYLYQLNGTRVLQFTGDSVDLKDLTSGMYILEIQQGKQRIYKTVIKK